MRRRAEVMIRIGLAVSLALLVAACSVGAQDQPRVTDDERVPFGLLDAEPPSGTAPTTAAGSVGMVFLVDPDGLLVPVPRFDPADGVDAAVDALVLPTTDDERALGLSSSLADEGEALVRSAAVANGLATVELRPGFLDLGAEVQRLAVAQVVVTMTGLPGVGQVAFTLDGEPVSVPLADGTTADGPVSRDDYADLLAG